jgi:2-amino-4-hydroxy-6-hydroxymethyldihydropteridine diphosphokinase
MNAAFLCLGGNMGDRLANLALAKELITEAGITIKAQSAIYETEAWGGVKEAPDYYNQCIKVECDLMAFELMQKLLDIEKRMGRVRSNDKNMSRTMDIDLLLYNDSIINDFNVEVPHPRMHLRQFVLKPLSEIAAKEVHPVLHRTIGQLLLECRDTLTAKKIRQDVHLH